ncbi:phytochrome B [Tanacetum coccineum]
MEMVPDTENMTISEYLKYKAAKERRLWDDVRSRRSPTKYNEADADSFHRNKSKTFSYPYSHNLTPPHPYFLPVQPYLKNYFVSTSESNDVDIKNMTIAEYNLYVAKQGIGMNPLRAENIKRMGNDIIQDSIWEHDDDLEEDQEEDGDDEDTFDIWDITVEDVERIRKIFNVPDELDDILQPLIPEPIHTSPPNDDYVAPASKSILGELLEEFSDEILNVAMIDEEADPTKDLEELERLLAMRPQSNFTKIQVHSVIINTKPFIHTQLMSPLYGVFKTSKPCKVDRDIISLGSSRKRIVSPSPVTLLQKETSKLFISHDVEEDNHDIEVAHMGNDPYFGIPIPEVTSNQSSHQTPVSTRLQLHEQALFCYYDAFLTSVEPKNYKEALTQAWIYKVSSDELGGCKIRGYRIFLAFAAHMNMVIYQMDVKTAFLNGNMREKLGYESCDQLDTTMWRSPNGMRIKDGKAVIITLSWSFGRDHKLIRTMALDSINSNYCDNTALLPYAATTFNTPDPNI